jgi:hypothetical protein
MVIMESMEGVVEARVSRRLSAPAERVFDAWLDPEAIRTWMASALRGVDLPGDVARVAVDPRVGGRFTFSDMRPGGEAAVLVMTEAVVRLIPGVLGNQQSHEQDSFSDGLLEGPSYTRPVSWRGLEVPPILLSGDHAKIAAWRREQAVARTRERRPDLLPGY